MSPLAENRTLGRVSLTDRIGSLWAIYPSLSELALHTDVAFNASNKSGIS